MPFWREWTSKVSGRRFAGKCVFITGASSGIGRALALEMAREGAKTALAARRTNRLAEVQGEIEALGGEAVAVSCDVTDRAAIDAAVARTAEVFGGIDVAIANAGFGVRGLFANLETADFRRQFEVNFFGCLDTIHAVLPYLEESCGRLGIVSSVLGRIGSPATSPYCSSKFALCGLAECLDYELRDQGVSLTLINPGVIASEFRQVDNQGARHPELEDHAPAWLICPADKAARAMVRALHRRQFECVVTRHGKLLTWLGTRFPRLFRLIMRHILAGRSQKVAEARHTPED